MKKIFYTLPKQLKQLVVRTIELIAFLHIKTKEKNIQIHKQNNSEKINVLIYHVTALSFGGTEKNLQMIAKYLNKDKYNVFLMHATKTEKTRLEYLKDSNVTILPFDYESIHSSWPYFINNMNPKLESVINQYNIDCIVTATPGQTIYPLINIKHIPIILINIFGSFSMQKNIKKHICISYEVKKLTQRVVHQNKLKVMYIPSEKPIINREAAQKLRERFNIKDNELVFGRIGRSDDSIFDPIGLLAFEIAVKENPNIHYLIMSPSKSAHELVTKHNIPNVHWLEPSFKEEDVWIFHQAIDVLAHFRLDGESCGLNIIESMLVGNPILTHKSHIWNAHLEYLDDSFSRYSQKDDFKQYAQNMIEFASLHQQGKLSILGLQAKEKAEKMFLIENVIEKYEDIINEAIK